MTSDVGFGSIVPGMGPAEAYAEANPPPVAVEQPPPDTGSTVAVPIAIDIPVAAALADAMVTTPDPNTVLSRWGVITAINADHTVDVLIDGITVPGLSVLAGYQPTVGETVQLNVVNGDSVVVGALAPSPRVYNRPTGDIEPTLRPTAKPDTLILNGQTVSRTTYANLWAWAQANSLVIAGMFNVGNGTTTFGVPDMRGRVMIGAGTLGADVYVLGATAGVAHPTITTAQVPPHAHNVAVAVAAHTVHTHSVSVDAHTAHNHSVGVSHSSTHTHDFYAPVAGNHGHDFYAPVAGGHTHGFGTSDAGTHDGHFPVAGPTNVQGGATFGVAAWNASSTWVANHSHTGGTDNQGSHAHSGTTGDQGSHFHSGTTGNDGSYTHTVSQVTGGPTTHAVNESLAGATTHAVTVTETALSAAGSIDVRQPSLAINWLVWT
jgi:microcystin-dependent protein